MSARINLRDKLSLIGVDTSCKGHNIGTAYIIRTIVFLKRPMAVTACKSRTIATHIENDASFIFFVFSAEDL